MNQLRLELCSTRPFAEPLVRVWVDNRELLDWAREWEQHLDAHVAGHYSYLPAGILRQQLAEGAFGLGKPEKTMLLGCDCGEAACWPLLASVKVQPDASIHWADFQQPFRKRWAYPTASFRFNAAEYHAALACLAATVSVGV